MAWATREPAIFKRSFNRRNPLGLSAYFYVSLSLIYFLVKLVLFLGKTVTIISFACRKR